MKNLKQPEKLGYKLFILVYLDVFAILPNFSQLVRSCKVLHPHYGLFFIVFGCGKGFAGKLISITPILLLVCRLSGISSKS